MTRPPSPSSAGRRRSSTAASSPERPAHRPLGLGPARRLALLALWVAASFVVVLASGSLSAHRVRDWIDGHGVLGPAIYIVVSSVLTLALFPGPLLAGVSGLLFGTALGTPVSIAAATLGAVGAFSVSRWAAGDAVQELGGPRLRAASDWVGQRGFRSVLYARIAPAVPYTLVNYAAGLTPVRLAAFTAATAVGVAPRAFAYTALGGSLGHLDSPEALIAVAVLVAMALGGLALARGERNRGAAARGRPPEA